MSRFKSAPATDVKNRFGDYLARVVHRREPLLIEKHGKPVALLVPYEAGDEAPREGRGSSPTPISDALDRLAKEYWKNHPDAKPFSAVDLIHKVREEEGGG